MILLTNGFGSAIFCRILNHWIDIIPSQFRCGPRLESVAVVTVTKRILGQVFLVFLLCLIKGGVIDDGRFDLFLLVGRDFLRIDVLLKVGLDVFGNFLLLVRRAKDDAPVLGSAVVPLFVQGRRVVELVKELHHFLKDFRGRRCFGRQLDVQDLNVAGPSAADLAIRRILHPVRIGIHKADLGVRDASGVFLLKVLYDVFFGSPVAAVGHD